MPRLHLTARLGQGHRQVRIVPAIIGAESLAWAVRVLDG